MTEAPREGKANIAAPVKRGQLTQGLPMLACDILNPTSKGRKKEKMKEKGPLRQGSNGLSPHHRATKADTQHQAGSPLARLLVTDDRTAIQK